MISDILKNRIENAYQSELSGNSTYNELATLADNENEHHIAGMLRDMAHEEKNHARYLAEILGKE